MKARTGDLAPLRPVIQSLLSSQEGRFDGTGAVMAPDALSDARLHLEWCQRAGTKGFRAVHLNLNPCSENYYDYTLKPWFAIPRDEGHGTVMGPYVDLHGTDLSVGALARDLLSHRADSERPLSGQAHRFRGSTHRFRQQSADQTQGTRASRIAGQTTARGGTPTSSQSCRVAGMCGRSRGSPVGTSAHYCDQDR